METRNAVIVDAVRSPLGRGGRGLLMHRHISEIAVEVIKELIARNPQVDPWLIEDMGVGNAARLFLLTARLLARLAGLPNEIAGSLTDRQCGSSMETTHQLARAIMLGEIKAGISVGAERMGNTLLSGFNPGEFLKKEGPKFDLMTLARQNEIQMAPQPDHDRVYSVPFPEYIRRAIPMMQMVQTAQNVVETYNIPRQELDEWSVKSHKKAHAATEAGRFKKEIVPIKTWKPIFDEQKKIKWDEKGDEITMDRDECIRPESTVEKLATLGPVKGVLSFSQPPKPVEITAGNSCPTNDGAAALLLMEEGLAKSLGLKPLARIRRMAVAGVKPQLMGLGPIPSSKRALERAGMSSKDIDLLEINEAFACQIIATMRELNLDPEKVNVNGGGIALGHALGCSGVRILTTLCHEMQRRDNVNTGLATMCIGDGQGIATIVEKM